MGDVFDTPEVPTPDNFLLGVDTLVIPVYEAAIKGIKVLDAQMRTRFPEPDGEPEIWLWRMQCEDMKFHAGNIGLVSLFTLFREWLDERRQRPDGWRCTFQKLEHSRGPGPLALVEVELEEITTARDSIIHHGGKAVYEYDGRTKTVSDRFLNFDRTFLDDPPDGKVAVTRSLLMDFAGRMKSQVQHWNSK